jgi:Mg-chelatase subunit ChlD
MAPDFAVEVFRNEYLPEGAAQVDAIVAVTATGRASVGPEVSAAEVIVVDTSGSMRYPPASAKRATAVAIDQSRDGVRFAVVAGTDTARVAHPSHEGRRWPTRCRGSRPSARWRG